MTKGKETCRILKEIRQHIAKANNIDFVTSKCHHKGDCLGTCPKCEAEVRYLEQQLYAKKLAGKALVVAGISASAFTMSIPSAAAAQSETNNIFPSDSINITATDESFILKGKITCILDSTSKEYPVLEGVEVINKNTNEKITTNDNGCFEIKASQGDFIDFIKSGYETVTIPITNSDPNQLTHVVMKEEVITLGGVFIMNPRIGYIDLNIIDENKDQIDCDNIYIEQLFSDENGNEYYEKIDMDFINDKGQYRIYCGTLNDKSREKSSDFILRIRANGYKDPVTIILNRPKYHYKKTIMFKH